jgi:hypothetical protein
MMSFPKNAVKLSATGCRQEACKTHFHDVMNGAAHVTETNGIQLQTSFDDVSWLSDQRRQATSKHSAREIHHRTLVCLASATYRERTAYYVSHIQQLPPFCIQL